MHEEKVTRTFRLNNYESINVEGYSKHHDQATAYKLAELDCLTKVLMSMIRIFNIRKQFNVENEYDVIVYNVVDAEIRALQAELQNTNS